MWRVLPALANYKQWCVSKHELSHERLLRYQLAHANLPHIMGNMLTLLAVGSEVSEALGCNQLVLLALYLACGWAGGLCAALLSNGSTVGEWVGVRSYPCPISPEAQCCRSDPRQRRGVESIDAPRRHSRRGLIAARHFVAGPFRRGARGLRDRVGAEACFVLCDKSSAV